MNNEQKKNMTRTKIIGKTNERETNRQCTDGQRSWAYRAYAILVRFGIECSICISLNYWLYAYFSSNDYGQQMHRFVLNFMSIENVILWMVNISVCSIAHSYKVSSGLRCNMLFAKKTTKFNSKHTCHGKNNYASEDSALLLSSMH